MGARTPQRQFAPPPAVSKVPYCPDWVELCTVEVPVTLFMFNVGAYLKPSHVKLLHTPPQFSDRKVLQVTR